MCNHTVLSQNESGYVIRCSGCKHVQLAFGTCVLCISQLQYEEFVECTKEQYAIYKNNGFEQQKVILLPTFNNNSFMVLNFKELEKLMVLIQEADIMSQVECLINCTPEKNSNLK